MKAKEINKADDSWLVEKVLQGDTAAFGLIIKNTEGLVAHIVIKMVRNTEDQRDLLQDVYLKAYKNLAQFRFKSKLSTWIGRIAYNTCLNYLEKKKLVLLDQNEDYTSEELLEALDNKLIDHLENTTESSISKNQLSQILKLEIERLSPVYKTLITLYHIEELSYVDIAKITELPIGTVKNYLFRARKAIKDNLLLHYKRDEL